jgi:predicted dehydrogenase
MEGRDAWAELSPAFGYHGNKLTWSRLEESKEVQLIPQIEEKNQFGLEMDHFCECLLEDKTPRTPGEEGLRDHRIMEAIYESAGSGGVVKLS